MQRRKNIDSGKFEKVKNHKLKKILIIGQIAFVLVLLILWMSVESLRESKSLWIFFLYNFPSQFLIAVVPHEPVLLYFSKFYSPLMVSAVAILGTLLVEYFNYNIFHYFNDFDLMKKVKGNSFVQKLIRLFKKAPFVALLIAGFTPVPFYPFRFLAVFAAYPVKLYLTAVFISRSLRFYVLAKIGMFLNLSDRILIVFFSLLVLIALIQFLQSYIKYFLKERKVKGKLIENPPLQE